MILRQCEGSITWYEGFDDSLHYISAYKSLRSFHLLFAQSYKVSYFIELKNTFNLDAITTTRIFLDYLLACYELLLETAKLRIVINSNIAENFPFPLCTYGLPFIIKSCRIKHLNFRLSKASEFDKLLFRLSPIDDSHFSCH